MEKIKATWQNKKLVFGHFLVKRESPEFVGVYERCGLRGIRLITSAPTLTAAAKKAKLLEMGYRMGYNDAKDIYQDGWNWR